MKHCLHPYGTGILLVSMALGSCANRGIGPQGGPKDTIPPVIVKSNPANGTLDYQEKEIEVVFNEYITINNPSENVLISPPQQKQPEIKAIGKKVKVEFKEPLRDSTTYTIDFGDAIQDNNEKNPYKDYTFSFTTAGPIDSLEIYGQLINAEDLNPLSGIIVGIHDNPHDSVLSTKPFVRIGKTNEEGEFYIRNIHPGTYRLFALNDVSKDYMYQPGEGLAWMEETISPRIDVKIEKDTIWRTDTVAADSSLIPDSVITAAYYYFEPSNLLLRYFKEDKQRQYFQRCQREMQHAFILRFGAPQKTMPIIRALRLESDSLGLDSTWVDFTQHSLVQASKNKDTIGYWLIDSAAIKMDSIRMEMTYEWTDSAYNIVMKTDTILAVYRAPKVSEKAKALQDKMRREAKLELKTNASTRFHIYDTLKITSPTPIARCEKDSMRLLEHVDTVWKAIPFELVEKDSIKMQYRIMAQLKPEGEYKLQLDSGAVVDIYGTSSDKMESAIRVRSKEDYATLTIKVVDCPEHAYLQLVDEKDKVVRTLPASMQGTRFAYLEAQTLYMRLFIDENGDGKWTTGDWGKKRQPENVYYSRKKLNLRANWEFEETLEWNTLPLLEQKPKAIRVDGNKAK